MELGWRAPRLLAATYTLRSSRYFSGRLIGSNRVGLESHQHRTQTDDLPVAGLVMRRLIEATAGEPLACRDQALERLGDPGCQQKQQSQSHQQAAAEERPESARDRPCRIKNRVRISADNDAPAKA